MKYISPKKTLVLLILSFLVVGGIYFLPIILENMVLQKIITVSYLVIGTALAVIFFLVNGASTSIIDGEYEKNFYKTIKNKTATSEGENLHWNPLKLSLAKRIYYSKITLCLLFPIVVMFFMEYIALLISQFE